MSYSEWKIPYEREAVPQSFSDAGFSPLLSAILIRRGITSPEEALRFTAFDKSQLCDPLMMTDMPQAVRRLSRAIASGEKVAVYGDYDVDGITSSCLMTSYLRDKGLDCELYIPDRLEEGYGLNASAIEALHSRGVTLIVTVDCGVTAIEETAFAASLGIDMIITDHHECRDELPGAIAVIDPKRPDCNYPSRDLAGVGVAFKLLCAMDGSPDFALSRSADLVAVGTIADVMPLIGENRFIIRAGLEKLHTSPRPGLLALIEEAGLAGKRITASSIGFSLAPRLNASGRLGQASLAAELLLTKSDTEAARLAAELCRLNRERQALETAIWNEALEMIGGEKPSHPLVLAHAGWHQGVIGIAASRLTEAFNVPAIMICLDGERGKGSCRSYGGFNLFEALSACSDQLESFGGHALAAGLTIKRENVDAFRQAIGRYYDAHPVSHASVLDIDLMVDTPELLDMRCVEELEKLEPCGNGNPNAMLCITGATLEAVTPIGGGRHLRLRLGKFGRSYDGVFFSKTAESLGLRVGDYVDAAFIPQINEFRGRRTIQLLLTDMRAHELSPARTVLRGELPAECEITAPSREDFVRVWRAFTAAGGSLSGSEHSVFEALGPGMRDLKLCVCLKVFEELGLVELRYSGAELSISRGRSEKVDLSSSRILKKLDG